MRSLLAFAALGCAFVLSLADGRGADEPRQTSAGDARGWAYRTPVRPPVPAVPTGQPIHNPIDAFLVARRREKGLTPSTEAPRAVLIRRLSFDLTGLPPTPEEVAAFLGDTSPHAYERLVERLLASPRHGERWALFWLDLVRYAESDGFKADDLRPQAWRYRDYVIRALNQDKPYDQFLREQLAGDELHPGSAEALVATGLHRNAPYEYNAVNLEEKLQDTLNDITDLTASAFLGLTVGCARCHDHKFDPITQEDYYRLQAFFAAWQPADAPAGTAEERGRIQDQARQWEARTAEVRRQMSELEEPARKKFTAQRKTRFPQEYQAMFDTPPAERTPRQQQIAYLVGQQVEVGSEEVGKSMKGETKEKWQALKKQMAAVGGTKPRQPTAMTTSDVGPTAPTTYLLKRGDWRNRGKEVPPGFLSALDDRYASIPAPAPGASTTGRRSVLAHWLTQPDNPLTGRVIVNRLWQHHFGRGIVGTPSDFGAQGEPPTHAELLDWLARELVDNGWSLKHVHRLIVTSAAYRQSSQWDEANGKLDPENRLLWRMNRRRLEGETLRDAVLAVNGQLDLREGGPSVYPEIPAELGAAAGKWSVSKDAADRNCRSVYVHVKRNLRYPFFEVHDAPGASESCARRHVSTNAPQALMLLNSQMMLDQAKAFAERVLREAGSEPGAVIERAYRLALGRSPDAAERDTMTAFLERQAKVNSAASEAFGAAVTDLCHALLNVNEFLYID